MSWEEFLGTPGGRGEAVSLTVGVFDGVHRGHQALLHEVSRNADFFPMVFTFSNNPLAALRPGSFLGSISTLPQKLERMKNFGVRRFVIIDFSYDFSKLEGRLFLSLIMDRLNVRKIVFGKNHSLGRGGDLRLEEAREFCKSREVELTVVPPVRLGDQRISSSIIRRALLQGEMALAEKLLGSPYALDVGRLPWERSGRKIVIDREAVNQILPPSGRYPVRCVPDGEGRTTELLVAPNKLEWAHPEDLPVKEISFLKFQ